MSYEKISLGESILVIPSQSKANLAIVFGGMSYANPQWMMEQTPSDYFDSLIVLYIPYTSSFKDVVPLAKQKIESKGIKIKDISLMGFSAGAIDVQENFGQDFYFVGLIDPSLKEQYIDLPFNSKTYMVYNPNNWGAYEGIQKRMPIFADKIKSLGGISEKVDLQHNKIPKYFFDKYKSEILGGSIGGIINKSDDKKIDYSLYLIGGSVFTLLILTGVVVYRKWFKK